MRKIKVFEISYDTDGEDVDLPETLEIEVSDDEEDVEGFLSEKICDITGYLHLGFYYTEE